MVPVVHRNRGAKRAREARAELGLPEDRPPACLLEVVEDRAGLPVVVTDRLPDGADGACYRTDRVTVLWVRPQWLPRQRFTLAHELAHAWCEHDAGLEVDSYETLAGLTTNGHEIEANAFAAELLAPREAVRLHLDANPTLEEVVLVAAHFGVSAWVVAFRLKTLGLTTEEHQERLEDELRDGVHKTVAQFHDLPDVADGLARAGASVPYVSPALRGTRLEQLLRARS